MNAWTPSQFISALLAIIVIDLVLAGDNAIVIALAARALPPHLQKRAIIWGAVGAIAVRSMMTVIVVWLLKIPGLMLAGGAMLVWIAYHLLLPDEHESGHDGPAATTFWGAMRTIVIADALMGLDNVLAVAGAAHGSYLLVVTGLVISVPIVVWGSTLVLKIVERYPGRRLLRLRRAGADRREDDEQRAADPALAARGADFGGRGLPVDPAGVVDRLRAQPPPARIAHPRPAGRVRPPVAAACQPVAATIAPIHTEGEPSMLKVLVPVDGSPNALRAVRQTIGEYRRHHELEVHLLNVQPPLSRHIARFVSQNDRSSWHQEQADGAHGRRVACCSKSGVPHQLHWTVGDRAGEICAAAERLGVHHIVMGTARKSSITRMLEDSITNKVLEGTPVPVEVVAGDAVSKWERWGLPAGGLGLGGLLLFVAID